MCVCLRVCCQRGRPNPLAWKRMDALTYTQKRTEKKNERKSLGTHFCHHLSSFNDPFSLAFSAHLSPHPLSVGTAARFWRMCAVMICALQISVWAIVCVSASARMFLSFAAKSLVTTYQRNIAFGHTRDGTQPPANPLLCVSAASHHPLLLHPKLSCWWETVIWHLDGGLSQKLCQSILEAMIAGFESITCLKVIMVLLLVYLQHTLKGVLQGTVTQHYDLRWTWFQCEVQAALACTGHAVALQTTEGTQWRQSSDHSNKAG